LRIDWLKIWDTNPNIFIASDWEECPEDKKRILNLPMQFNYFSSGDLNLRIGIVATSEEYKDEELLLAGIVWGMRMGNGVRTIIYFVAPNFRPVLLAAMAEIGDPLTLKAVYWREKLTPSLYPVSPNLINQNQFPTKKNELRPGWDYWRRQLNPVAYNHLKIIKDYFESLAKRRVRPVMEKNKILYYWGNIEIAEIKRKGNKFELTTKIKWTRNKNITRKFLKPGWVDISGMLNEEFCRAINGILELLENMEQNGLLDAKDLLSLILMYDKDVANYWGEYFEFPWQISNRKEALDIGNYYFFKSNDQINILSLILDKPLNKLVNILLCYNNFKRNYFNRNLHLEQEQVQWNRKIYILCFSNLETEIMLSRSWLKMPENYPVVILPEDWKTEGFRNLVISK